ncbi:gliding motility-associated-like protein [Kordia periserrulae]|uniref:Gliding motility-associated-like protein n=1 Tax=Kordia periserrulae TaxID=701523 RepID=A0A2T6C3G8_9FLAO|nr:T9SS type B sorting domain-containing protein [Kordia periserrulae]PTX62859.1 gliding motility-associated-like protein [Kordia periserrulae]
MIDMKETTLKLFCILLFISMSANAQREAANWFFGVNAGLDFNTGIPVSVDTGQTNTLEGCSAISDADGNLLFYTDGVTVWNQLHQMMPNGTDLAGSLSSTQSCIIVPNPSNANLFYIFTTDVVDAYNGTNQGPSNGFNYSIVDMTLAGGLGDVTTKNVNLLVNGSEKVSATLSTDGNFWVVTHRNNQFFSFKVTAAGVNTIPIVSNTSTSIPDFNNIRGNMKISPNGQKLAIAHTLFEPVQSGSLYLYDFDSTTGFVSNPSFLGDEITFYGVEFSSNSTRLYATGKFFESESISNIQVQQYDVTAADVANTKFIVFDYPAAQITPSLSGSLQLGLDKRIYHALPSSKLSTINSPNLLGNACDFDFESVDLGMNFSRFGLPAAVQSFYESIATIENFCLGDQTTFTVISQNNVIGVNWNFGDPASGSANTANEISTSHVFSNAGTFTVTAEVSFSDAPNQIFTEIVVIQEVPNIAPLFTIQQCDVDENDSDGLSIFNLQEAISVIEEDNGDDNIDVLFFESITDAQLNENNIANEFYANSVNNQILYARVFSYIDCFTITQVRLNVSSGSNLGVYDTIDVCEVDETNISISQIENILQEDFPNALISIYSTRDDALLLENQLTDFSFVDVNLTDELFFRVSYGSNCGFIGSVQLNIVSQPTVEDQQAFLCGQIGAAVELSFDESFSSYVWSTNETTPSIMVTETGTYTVVVTNSAGCEKEVNYTVVEEPPIVIDEIAVQDFQDVNTITIVLTPDTDMEAVSYSINGGNTFVPSNEFVNMYPGVYDVVVRRGECDAAAETILVGGFPKFFTPNGDNTNDTWELIKKEFYPNAFIELYDRYGKNLVNFKAEGSWDGTYRGMPLPSGDYWYKLTLESGRVVTGNVTLRR